jgi:hypothetical protein
VSFIIDGYETLLRDLIRQSKDLPDLESRIPIILGQFLAQYGIATSGWNSHPPHREQAHIPPSMSSIPDSSLGVDSTNQPVFLDGFDHMYGFNDDDWLLQNDDFVVSAENVYSDWTRYHDASNNNETGNDTLENWDLIHDISNNMSTGDTTLDHSDFEEGLLRSTSVTKLYEVPEGIL